MVNYLDILAETIRSNWNQPALTDFYLTEDGKAQDTSRGNHYTYGEMYQEIVRVANLLTNLGLQKGDHIAICGANSSHWVIAYLAIAKMQGVSVTIMHSLQPEQIAQMVDFSDAKAIFTDLDLWNELKDLSLPQIESVISLEDWKILRGNKMSNHSLYTNERIGFDTLDVNCLQSIYFSSGSTSSAKGVMLSYKNISAAVQETTKAYFLNISKDNIKSIAFLPLAHIFGLGGHLIPLISGVHIYIFPISYSAQQIITSIMIIRPFCIFSVPLIASVFFTAKEHLWAHDIQNSLKYLIIGGGDLPISLEHSLLSFGIPLFSVYGATETTAPVSLSSTCKSKNGASGQVISTLACRIAPNGEILVKGENVMLGYYKDPEATAQKIDADGWLHTGDKGHLDEDGYLYVEGRLEQDIIVLPNGENIRPDTIESLINALPEVSESIVLARDGKLVARVVLDMKIINSKFEIINIGELRRHILRMINPQLPLFSQLYDVEITYQPLARTEKQTLKRYLYK